MAAGCRCNGRLPDSGPKCLVLRRTTYPLSPGLVPRRQSATGQNQTAKGLSEGKPLSPGLSSCLVLSSLAGGLAGCRCARDDLVWTLQSVVVGRSSLANDTPAGQMAPRPWLWRVLKWYLHGGARSTGNKVLSNNYDHIFPLSRLQTHRSCLLAACCVQCSVRPESRLVSALLVLVLLLPSRVLTSPASFPHPTASTAL